MVEAASTYIKIEKEKFDEEEYSSLVKYFTEKYNQKDTVLPDGIQLRRRRARPRIEQYSR
jgi:hypothetical protein